MKKIFPSATTAAALTVVTMFALGTTGGSWASEMDKGMNNMSDSKNLTKEEQHTFSQLDSNKDGKISQEEAKNNRDLTTKFNSVDSNHDNAVDEGEFARFEMDSEQGK